MKQTFIEQLNEISEAAQQAIAEQIVQQKSMILFSATGDEDEEWTTDIYDEIPDFPFYDKHGFVGYAAIKEMHGCDHGIEITGILKGDDYPKEIKVMLNELDDYSSAALADYIFSQITVTPRNDNKNEY